ncbi:MAG: DUF3604 domain-containing protein [Anaerolineaceae bacterium]|nr:MAG: DUF3604 domain-containing protein [Anaerolineaceae bacterium]
MKMSSRADASKSGLKAYFGDIHNHCGVSYGHGTLQDALSNARLQLDFVSVTVHAVWPDLPADDPALQYLIDYHRQGFLRAQANWPGYLQTMEQYNEENCFITFPSFEWHSIEYGDYCVYYQQGDDCPIIDAPDLPALRDALRSAGRPAFMIPHHIGYRQGSRGINWAAFNDEFSPVAEIFSFHGLSESSEGPYPYLHSMGPRHEHSTAQYGWAQGNVFGVVGSTDHHNAFPGSYGYGRMGVLAESLTRPAIWDAIRQRRTYALSGDRIALDFTLNGAVMGAICPPDDQRWIDVSVCGGDTIDYIEVLHNNRVIHRHSPLHDEPASGMDGRYKVYVEMGWAEQHEPFAWDVALQVENGLLRDVEPRLRGYSPTAEPNDDQFAYSELTFPEQNRVHLRTRTRKNHSLHSAATEGFVLEIDATAETQITVQFNGQTQTLNIAELATGSRTFYTGGFVSPAICLHRAVPRHEYTQRFAFTHHRHTTERDWYYVRVRQKNDQWAWSSPVWVAGTADK